MQAQPLSVHPALHPWSHHLGGRREGRDRLIAALLGRPPETVRGWLRRFAGRVEPVHAVFTGWCRDLAPDPALPRPAGSAWADAIAAIPAAAAAASARFGIGEVPAWQAAAVSATGCWR